MKSDTAILDSPVCEFYSVREKIWRLAEVEEREVLTLSQKHNLEGLLSRILIEKKISHHNVLGYLDPKIRDSLPDPFHLKDMDKAAARIVEAIKKKEKIAVFGDYDVDGATSSALLKRFFHALAVDVEIYIPDRITEGYGPNIDAFNTLKEKGIKVVITVDCGTLSFEPLLHAKKIELDVIVIDHHISDTKLPEAVAVVNPNRLDESSECTYLAAVGVCFLFVIAVNKLLKESSYYKDKAEPNLISFLDIVALGTVCDVVPLIGLNRALVAQGLKIMSQRKNIGLAVLSDIAGIQESHTPYHLGFILGPRINAGGRVGESHLGSSLLSSNDYSEVERIANKLDRYNAERKAIEQCVLEEATRQAEEEESSLAVIVVYNEGWHQGVIGIIAGRLKEQFNKPVAVISLENGIGKASCRSIKGIDFGSSIISAKIEGIIEQGGGHAMAAGFTIKKDKIEDLKNFLNEKFTKQYNELTDMNTETFSGFLTTCSLTPTFIKNLEQIGPFGSGNREPRFMLKNICITKVNIFGGAHIFCFITDKETGITIKANAFRCVDTVLGETLLNTLHKNISLIGYARINRWQGNEKVEFNIEDIIIS